MTTRRPVACVAGILVAAALTACGDPEPSRADYVATHIGFWTVAAEVGEEQLGQPVRADLESYLNDQWNDQTEQARWSAVYDGVCEELREDEEPDVTFGLVDQLEQQGIARDAAIAGVVEQVQVIVDNLCPSQADAIEDLRGELIAR